VPKAALYIPAGVCLAALTILLRRAGSGRQRWIVLGGAVVVSGLVALLIVLVWSRALAASSEPGLGIWRDGDRLFARATGAGSSLNDITAELLPESEIRWFDRLSAKPATFSRNARGKVTGFTMCPGGQGLSYGRISDQPPQAPVPRQPRVAIKLDTKLLDAYVGRYEFAPNAVRPAGMQVTIRRAGDQLIVQACINNAP
jgi:hypothetical protein